MDTGGRQLSGRRVLVLEDEYFIAQDLSDALAGEGAEVIGPFQDVASAQAAMQDGPPPHIGVLDINLGGQMTFEMAASMREHGIPFVFATGYEPATVPPAFAEVPVWRKPFLTSELVTALRGLLGQPDTAREGTKPAG